MAQRVFLVQMPKDALASAADAICRNAVVRAGVARDLAAASAAHLRRVTISEMISDAAERSGKLPEEWGYARNCMPYLIADRDADGVTRSLDALERLDGARKIEGFFVEQARRLGVGVRSLDRKQFVEPRPADVESWILDQLDRASTLREEALKAPSKTPAGGDADPLADYAISTWIWLGRIFARTRPAFWQGRNRWLGGAAFPDVFHIETTAISIGGEGRAEDDPEMRRIIQQNRELTRGQLAKKSVQRLRELIVSTARLSPVLAIRNWEASLPKEGGGNLASGCVETENLEELVAVLRKAQRKDELPYDTGNEWVEIVAAAAARARVADAHLVEGDDSIDGAYRWPAIEG